MKILVMAAGAVGGYFGGMLAKSGEDVVVIARGPNLKAIQKNGLRVESVASGNFTVQLPAADCLDGSWSADLVLLCVKSYHNEHAIQVIKPAVGDSTTILTLENGIGSGDQLAAAFGKDKVLLGAAYIGAKRTEPGVFAEVDGSVRVVFGEEDGRESTKAIAVGDVLKKTGAEIELSSNVLKALWNKFVYICALSGMTCVTRSTFAEVMDTPETHSLVRRVMQEAAAVGKAKDVNLDDNVVESTMAHFEKVKHELISSMYADLEAGNPLELDALNGAIARLGKEVGVATPVNDFITACLALADNRGRARLKLA